MGKILRIDKHFGILSGVYLRFHQLVSLPISEFGSNPIFETLEYISAPTYLRRQTLSQDI
jgi:hypothetical protein